MNKTCNHRLLTKFSDAVHCVTCGALISSSSTTIKDSAYNTRADVSPALLLSNMLEDQIVSRHYNPKAAYIPVLLLVKIVVTKRFSSPTV